LRDKLPSAQFQIVERARATITRYEMLREGDPVVVALSGGPDSTCLLDVLRRSRLDLEIVVAHVDHGISDTSEEVAARVSATAARDGYEVHLARAQELSAPNLQAKARDFRYDFFDIVARQTNHAKVATGHTLDDRVETTLARLLHGAGTGGVAGIPPHEGNRIRPLIDVRRAEARGYCDALELEYHDDPANEDDTFERVAVRRRLVAAMEERWGEGAIRAVARSADRLREDSAALDELKERLYAGIATGDEEGEITLQLGAVRSMPRALRRRVLEEAVGRIRDRAAGIDEVLEALDRYDGSAPKSFDLAGGGTLRFGEETIVVSRMPR
jgi:tRNA(Ile)-lysidine synthase